VGKVCIIADLGSSFRGDMELAKRGIEAAKECGADVAKFQLYTGEELFGFPHKMDYEMPREWVPLLKEHSDKVGIEFMITAFSPGGVLFVDPYVTRHKIASSEFCHVGIIDAAISTRKSIVASTGGHGHLDVNGFGEYLAKAIPPGECREVTLLECVALYPAPTEAYDLANLPWWLNVYHSVGISDHTTGYAVAVAAVGAGATTFEKHFDPWGDDFNYPKTPDSPVSMDTEDFRAYVAMIREAASAMGDGIKQPRHQHEAQTHWKRRLIATQSLVPGDTLRYDGTGAGNFGIYRSLKPDTNGLPPWAWEQVNGKTVNKPKAPGDSIGPRDVG
jgi:sialic acid synthase SpsE